MEEAQSLMVKAVSFGAEVYLIPPTQASVEITLSLGPNLGVSHLADFFEAHIAHHCVLDVGGRTKTWRPHF